MLPLKIFLYTICFLSLSWSAILFAGPFIIAKIIDVYSNGQLVASSVKVTPKFDIKIGRLEYTSKSIEDQKPNEGFSRSIGVFWSIFSEEPLLKVRFGPTLVRDIFTSDSITFYIPSFSEINFKEIPIKAEIVNLNVQSRASIEEIKLEALYQKPKDLFSKISLNMHHLAVGELKLWNVNTIRASISDADLKVPIDQQKFKVKISTDEIENAQRNIQVLGLEGFLNVFGDELDFEFQLQTFLLSNAEYLIEKLNAHGMFSNKDSSKHFQIEILDTLDYVDNKTRPRVLFEFMMLEDEKYHLKLVGNSQQTELKFDDFFIGTLPAHKLVIDVYIDSIASEASAQSRITFRNSDVPPILGNSNIIFELGDSAKISDCYRIDCEIKSVHFKYRLESETEWVSGESGCLSPPCSLPLMRHKFITSNTKEIFELINDSKILNPLYTAYLLTIMNNAEKIGDGHKFTIN